MKKITKIISIILVLSLVIAIPTNAMAATSNKKQIEKTVKNFYSYSKKMNIKKMKSCVYKGKLKYQDSVFVKTSKKYNKNLSVSIKSVKIKKKEATVKAKVKYKSLYDAYYNTYYDLILWTIVNPDASQKQMTKKYNVFLNSEIKDNKPKTKNKTITISMIKYKGKWKIKKVTNNMYNTIHCDVVKATDDVDKEMQ